MTSPSDEAMMVAVATVWIAAVLVAFLVAYRFEIQALIRRWRRGGNVTELVGRRATR